jgi:FkbH-like protein
MKVLIITNVTLDPIVRKINKTNNQFFFDLNYTEDLNAFFLELKNGGKSVLGFDLVFIHADAYFHNNSKNWQSDLLFFIYEYFKNINVKVLISNAFNIGYEQCELSTQFSQLDDYLITYSSILEKIRTQENIYFFDFKNLIFSIGNKNSYNYNLGFLYQMPYKKEFISLFSTQLKDHLNFLMNEEKKLIVLDCDNTLWSGILGEDGIEGIQCDKNAKSIVYYEFQRFLKSKKEEGFLLCLCSKNNEHEVKDAFFQKKMPLSWDDFIIKKINWDEKHKNIIEIATELGLGQSSFIFIDDNEFEINSVRELTEVDKFFVFTNSYENLKEITKDFCFRRRKILEDDRKKTISYFNLIERNNTESSTINFEDYLKSLNLKLTVNENDLNDLQRLSQLTQKTNQFNFNKIEITTKSLQEWIEYNNYIYSLKISDKYGDYGTVGLILIKRNESNLCTMENFIMSCRALGKRVENDFFDKVIKKLESKSLILKNINFKKTEKNKPAQFFLQNILENGYEITKIK